MAEAVRSKVVEETLSQPDVHDGWENIYRNAGSERFYDLAFDFIAKAVNRPDTVFLDVGCGSAAHSMRLARHGYFVHAVDFSESVVANAQRNVAARDLDERIKVSREDILDMTFADGEFDNVLCWGVMMHMPDPERAIAELDRVLRKGGKLVFSEANAYSMQSIVFRILRKLLGKKNTRSKWTPAGVENWEDSEAGELLTRQANIPWLEKQLRDRGYQITHRVAGGFSEIHTRFSSPRIKAVIHWFNRFWFQYVRLPQPALSNIIIAEKTG